jgi:hypothetical protein
MMDNQNPAGQPGLTTSVTINEDAILPKTPHVAGEPVVDEELQKMIADQLAQLNVGGSEITYEYSVNPQIVVEQPEPNVQSSPNVSATSSENS